MHPAIHAILSNPHAMAQIERALAARGRGGDDNIVHVNDQEMASLHAMGGSGTINPKTGLREFNQVGPGGASGGQGGLGGANGDALGGGGGNVAGHVGGSGAEHNGQGGFIVQPGRPIILPPPAQVAPPVMLPPPPPANIPVMPMMSQTAGSNLIGNRFGALPSWATQQYQIGTMPTSYPVSGQPFGAPTGAPQPPMPPVMPPPVAPGGGGQPGGGGGFNGGGGGNPGAGGGTPGNPFAAILPGWHYPTQNNVLPQPAPPNPSQIAMMQKFGITPPQMPAQARPQAQGPSNMQQQILAALQGAQPKMSNAGTPTKQAATKPGATQFLNLLHK